MKPDNQTVRQICSKMYVHTFNEAKSAVKQGYKDYANVKNGQKQASNINILQRTLQGQRAEANLTQEDWQNHV